MKLSPDQIEKVNEHMETYKDRTCAVCGNTEWASPYRLYALEEINPDFAHSEGNKMLPLMPLICTNCGNIILFSTCFRKFKIDEVGDCGD